MEYSTLKVPELRKLLQERNLLATGNKADLVARLQEDDKNKAPAAAQPAAEDEIDYSDDDVTVTTKAAESKAAAAPEAAAAEPAPAAETTETTEPAKDAPAAETTEGEAPADGAEEAAAEPSKYALNLPATAVDEETRKREERAKRFGVVQDDNAAKKAERAKRFGLDEASLAKSLDSALPERSLKRRGQNDESAGRKRQDRHGNANANNNANNRRGRGRQGRTGGGRNEGGVAKTGGSLLDDPAEKAKAEARAKRFGAA